MSKLLEHIIRNVLLHEQVETYKNCKDLKDKFKQSPELFGEPGDDITSTSVDLEKQSLYAFQELSSTNLKLAKEAGAVDGFNAIMCLNLSDSKTVNGVYAILNRMYKQNLTSWIQDYTTDKYVILRSAVTQKGSQKIDHWIFEKDAWSKLAKPNYYKGRITDLKANFIRAVVNTAQTTSDTLNTWRDIISSPDAKEKIKKLSIDELLKIKSDIINDLESEGRGATNFSSIFDVNVKIRIGSAPLFSINELYPNYTYPKSFRKISSKSIKNVNVKSKYKEREIEYPYNIPLDDRGVPGTRWVYTDNEFPNRVFILGNSVAHNYGQQEDKVTFWFANKSAFEVSMQGAVEDLPSLVHYGVNKPNSNRQDMVEVGSELEKRLMKQAKQTGDLQ